MCCCIAVSSRSEYGPRGRQQQLAAHNHAKQLSVCSIGQSLQQNPLCNRDASLCCNVNLLQLNVPIICELRQSSLLRHGMKRRC